MPREKEQCVLSKQNEKKDILEVYYVNGLKDNLISLGQLTQHGYEVTFKGPTCRILDKSPSKRLIANITMKKNRLYSLWMKCSSQPESYAHSVSHIEESWLWNHRYGHLPLDSLS